jgi:glycosyltransferase involved in cell wall biosynthesis
MILTRVPGIPGQPARLRAENAMTSVPEKSESRMIDESGDISVSIVIPAHNEAMNLQYVLPRIPGWVHEVILVNDHSTDDTVEVASKLLPAIRVVHTEHGRGKGTALQVGFAAATGDIIVMMDADGSSDPGELPRFVQALLSGAYLAKGSRFIGDGGSSDITPLRLFGSRVLIWIANLLFGMHFTDMFCGMNAFWKDCLDFFDIDCPGFEIEAQLHLRICKANLEIAEVPSFEHARIYGDSKFSVVKDGWRVLRMIVQERVNGRSVIRTARIKRIHHPEISTADGQAITEQIGAAGYPLLH